LDLLDLVEEDLFRMRPEKRKNCEEIVRKLKEINAKCTEKETGEAYCTKFSSKPRRTSTNISELTEESEEMTASELLEEAPVGTSSHAAEKRSSNIIKHQGRPLNLGHSISERSNDHHNLHRTTQRAFTAPEVRSKRLDITQPRDPVEPRSPKVHFKPAFETNDSGFDESYDKQMRGITSNSGHNESEDRQRNSDEEVIAEPRRKPFIDKSIRSNISRPRLTGKDGLPNRADSGDSYTHRRKPSDSTRAVEVESRGSRVFSSPEPVQDSVAEPYEDENAPLLGQNTPFEYAAVREAEHTDSMERWYNVILCCL
jgi:hypothetical protein